MQLCAIEPTTILLAIAKVSAGAAATIFGPIIRRRIETGSWWEDENKQAIKDSSNRINECLTTVLKLKEMVKDLPDNDHKSDMLHNIEITEKECAGLAAQHIELLARIAQGKKDASLPRSSCSARRSF